jgi:DNA-binding response OmpR family regulator
MKNNHVSPVTELAAYQRSNTRIHRILVVEDDNDIRRLTTQMLNRSGYQAEAANDGESAWHALRTNNYDLLITDHKMPKVSGLALLRKLRSARMKLPVILVSGSIKATDMNRHPRLQPATALLKPYTLAEFQRVVKSLLSPEDNAPETKEPSSGWQEQPSTKAFSQ